MTDHQYPKGAIESEAAVREILAAVWPCNHDDEATVSVFYVHGLGSSSYTTEYVLGHNAEIRENYVGLFINTNAFGSGREFSLGDCNIGSHHNQHYLFANLEDAETYLEYAKVNTPDIRHDWDDYDYIDPWRW